MINDITGDPKAAAKIQPIPLSNPTMARYTNGRSTVAAGLMRHERRMSRATTKKAIVRRMASGSHSNGKRMWLDSFHPGHFAHQFLCLDRQFNTFLDNYITAIH
jgi:hypothetical protein